MSKKNKVGRGERESGKARERGSSPHEWERGGGSQWGVLCILQNTNSLSDGYFLNKKSVWFTRGGLTLGAGLPQPC